VLALAVLPVGRNMVALDWELGLLFFFAVGSAAELAVFLAGWSSQNKYALLGSMRAIAQLISYEIPMLLAAVPVVMVVGSMAPTAIVEAQGGNFGWYVFTPWGLAGFLLFLVAAAAESNRSPFDLPEGESEIIAGYLVEYSGFKFALFFLAEYFGLFAACGLGITLFLGGWQAPVTWLNWIPSYLWFFLKLLTLIAGFVWLRGTVPRLRVDQLMALAWKLLLPMTLVNLVAVAIWQWLDGGVWRWAATGLLLLGTYFLLGRGALRTRGIGPRIYRYADEISG